jgi:hypothetical protein
MADPTPRVKVGQVWRDTETGRKYRVTAPNVNTEAGPDSWVMSATDTEKSGSTLYMHHHCRLEGKWTFYG